MRKEADIKQWARLYELALKLKEQRPWDFLSDADLIAIQVKGQEEPVYCCTMGSGGEYYAVACYIGQQGLADLYSVMTAEESDLPLEYIMLEQSNLSCCYGRRDEVSPEQKKVIKELGYRFRGEGNWIYFESYQPGYIPYILDQPEAELLLAVYPELIRAIQAFCAGEIAVDFEAGMHLLRRYDEGRGEYVNESVKLPAADKQYPNIGLANDLQKKRLKKQKRVDQEIVLDLFYMNRGVKDRAYDRPVNPQILLMMDVDSEMILAAEMLTPEMDLIGEILNTFCGYIEANGRVNAAVIRNPLICGAIAQTCKDLDIDLYFDEETMELVDDVIFSMRQMS